MTLQAQYEIIASYHEATKHHLHRYARSAGYMDWANQPNPFRQYENVPQVDLPFCRSFPDAPFGRLFSAAPTAGRQLSLATIASFLELSLAISAWKGAGNNRWPLRVNPSSGNLHPTEGYLIIPDLQDLTGGLYHYSSLNHALERRVVLPDGVWMQLVDHFAGEGFLVALSSIFWRESWKYGERAYRYCNLDTGHALAALAFAARMHDWHMCCLNATADSRLHTLLGFDQTVWHANEDEVPELICWISQQPVSDSCDFDLPAGVASRFTAQSFSGRPAKLSSQALDWPIIGQAAAATAKETTQGDAPAITDNGVASEISTPAADVIRKRRSAVQFDPGRIIDRHTLFAILSCTLAASGRPPFDMGLGRPLVDLLLFIHHVQDIDPGLYLLKRQNQPLENLQAVWQADFLWRPVDTNLPMWQLTSGDVRQTAATLSCHQDIAGDSAFAVAMLASYDHILRRAPYRYRHLHWECGIIGQVFYLAAEAYGLRGTGIGCYFDDEVHRLLGIEDKSYQSLYHFTVGHPIEDHRITTLPAYHHIDTTQR